MKKVFLLFFLIIFLIQITHGLGIAQEYIKDNTLNLYPGQERSVKLIMQNSDDTPLEINLTLMGGDIATIHNAKETYVLPAKSYENNVFINITVPKNAKPGDTFNIRYSMMPIMNSDSDPTIKMAMKISQPINIIVIPEPITEKEEKEKLLDNNLFLLFGFLVLVLAFWRLGALINKKV